MVDLEEDVKARFGIDVGGKLAELQKPMDMSLEIYEAARIALAALPGFDEILRFDDIRPNPIQQSDSFEEVYSQAAEAQELLTTKIAKEWQPDPSHPVLRHPVKGTECAGWVEMADDPGVKGKERSEEKMKNDYDGHANKLKDLSRLTLRFSEPAKLASALRELKTLGFTVIIQKNNFANPTPLGYSDFNLVVEVCLASGKPYLCEMQLNMQLMLEAKNKAHTHYEVIRSKLPKICEDYQVEARKLEVQIGCEFLGVEPLERTRG